MKSRGNKSSAALIEKRRSRLLELKQQGKTTIEVEEILTSEGFPADRVTLWRDLKGMMVKLEANNSETYMQLKQEQDTILRRMEELVITEQVDPEIAREWRAIRKDIGELWGLNAPSKSISANINVEGPAATRTWQRALYELRLVPEAKHNEFWERSKPLIDELSVQPTFPRKELTDGKHN
jgi:hypothetical protein